MKTAIIYHSVMSSTERTAKIIAEEVNGDLYKINKKDTANPSMVLMAGKIINQLIRPKQFKDTVEKINLDEYDRIFIGSPCWNFTFSPVIKKFIEETDLEGKEIVFFLTHDGGPGETIEKFKKSLEDSRFLGSMDFGFVRKTSDEDLKRQVRNKLTRFK